MIDFRLADLDAALLDDGHDRAHEVLVRAHAAGDAVHDDADDVRVRCSWIASL